GPEPFGLVGLEAAREGLPAIAFDVGGVREWLRPGITGWLATGRIPTVSSLAAALWEAVSDPAELKRRGRAARQLAGEMSLNAHLDRLERVFAAVQGHQ